MLVISPNIGHMFFGAFILGLAMITLADIVAVKPPKQPYIDRLWGPVLLAVSVIYFSGLSLSLSLSQMIDVKSGSGQHVVLSLIMLATAVVMTFCTTRPRIVESARVL